LTHRILKNLTTFPLRNWGKVEGTKDTKDGKMITKEQEKTLKDGDVDLTFPLLFLYFSLIP
jgi:hypothetical protein